MFPLHNTAIITFCLDDGKLLSLQSEGLVTGGVVRNQQCEKRNLQIQNMKN